ASCRAGLGEPVFDKLDGELARALMSIGAVKGVEIGSGFRAAEMLGSENNDPIAPAGFLGNNAGGILAGISTGEDIIVRVAVKPIPSIHKEQKTVNTENEAVSIKVGGRHDISAIPRIIPVCEAMVRLTLADHLLRQQAVLQVPNEANV
ncbi:MAG: chorismate synthase, partial [Candidatus Electrothrix sp. AR4]|nr:chorismate synthase [Candidatus Electrothrix sp. AR4]